jgi:OPA family glycerol-3-phosphate transporter-like MFS transporter
MLTLGENLEQGMMKRAVLAMSLSVVIGTLISYGGASLFNLIDCFHITFLLGTVVTVGIGVIWFFSYDSLVAEKPVATEQKKTAENSKASKSLALSAMVGLLVVCGLFAIVDNLVKDGLNTWSPVILKEQFGFEDSISIVLTLVLPIFGVFGSMLAMRTNRVIKDFRNLIGFFYLLLSACLCGLFFALRLNGVILTLVLFGLISCLTHGINSVLTSIMPLAMRDKMNTGFLAGLMNATCYIGSTVSAYGLGKIADGASWNFVIQLLFMASFAAVLLSVGVIFVNAIGKNVKKKV